MHHELIDTFSWDVLLVAFTAYLLGMIVIAWEWCERERSQDKHNGGR